MKNQFIYTVEAKRPPVAPETEEVLVSFKASFNLEKVIRSMTTEEGKVIVILDDFHEETRQSVTHNQNGKPIVKNETVMLQSEIVLNKEDGERFYNITDVEK
jgi:hypothetical protein